MDHLFIRWPQFCVELCILIIVTFLYTTLLCRWEFPHINIRLDGDKVGSFTNIEAFKKHEFAIQAKEDNPVLSLVMDNDTVDFGTGEDRNSFIRYVLFEKIRAIHR